MWAVAAMMDASPCFNRGNVRQARQAGSNSFDLSGFTKRPPEPLRLITNSDTPYTGKLYIEVSPDCNGLNFTGAWASISCRFATQGSRIWPPSLRCTSKKAATTSKPHVI